MKEFAALMRLQLLSRYADYKPRHIRAQLKENNKKRLLQLFGAAVLIVYLLVFLVGVENAIMDALIPMGLADLMPGLAVALGALGTLVMAFFFVMSALYFNRDAVMLAALPIRTRTLLSARLAQVWLSETCVNALILLPAGIIYALKLHEAPLYYVRLLVVWLFLSVLPVIVVTWVSTLLIRISALWKHRETVATVGGIILLAAYMAVCFGMGMATGENGELSGAVTEMLISRQGIIEAMLSFFPPLRWAAAGLTGDIGQLLLFVGVSAAAAALTVWVLGYFYRGLSLLQGETGTAPVRRARAGASSYRQASVFAACCQREWRSLVRVSSYAVNTLPTAFMPVFMVAALYFGIVRAGGVDQSAIRALESQFPPSLIVGGMALVMGYMMGINPAAASAVSREGRGHDFYLALPITARTRVLAKLAVSFGLSAVGTVAGTVTLMLLFPYFRGYAALALVICLLYGFMTTALALARDVKHPRLDWVTENEAIKQSSGVLMGLLISWGVLVALAVVSYFLISTGMSAWLYTLILSVPLLALCWLTGRQLVRTAEKAWGEGAAD